MVWECAGGGYEPVTALTPLSSGDCCDRSYGAMVVGQDVNQDRLITVHIEPEPDGPESIRRSRLAATSGMSPLEAMPQGRPVWPRLTAWPRQMGTADAAALTAQP